MGKVQIQTATGIPVAEQSIIYEPYSVVDGLADGNALTTYGVPIEGNAMLALNPNRMKCDVMSGGGELIPVDVDMTDTVDKIKLQVQQKIGTPIAEQKLFFNGKEITDGDMIDNDITEGSRLLVNP